jgi:hypothetical protein
MSSFSSPIFIVGANRSGTTLLRLMLNAHSRIAIPEEMTYFRSQFDGESIENWRSPNLSSVSYKALVAEFVDRTVALHPELDMSSLKARILNDGPQDLRRPYQEVLEAWARQNGKERWGEKTPGNLFYVDIINQMFPDAIFLYVVRDPRAGVASMMKTDFFPNDVVFNAMSRRKHADVGEDLLKRHIPEERWCTIRYEDLTSIPEQTLRRVCDLIGEAYEPSMLTFYRTADAYMKKEAATTFNAAANQPVTAARIDAWRDVLSDRDVSLIERICGAEMRRWDYHPTGLPLPLGARLEIKIKEAYWFGQTLRNRGVRHYTVKHVLFARLRTRWHRLKKGLSVRLGLSSSSP